MAHRLSLITLGIGFVLGFRKAGMACIELIYACVVCASRNGEVYFAESLILLRFSTDFLQWEVVASRRHWKAGMAGRLRDWHKQHHHDFIV